MAARCVFNDSGYHTPMAKLIFNDIGLSLNHQGGKSPRIVNLLSNFYIKNSSLENGERMWHKDLEKLCKSRLPERPDGSTKLP
ncbi:hypothetical protein CRG98_042649 [Punica granatum]|uniref:Uncharacterized protein n=1 Tax=Punica granatum TaxID=22663 RepID=A0A2I0HZ32_PUNGR|nr:hypothetical protein CRG98_042649 [Punica granatum]